MQIDIFEDENEGVFKYGNKLYPEEVSILDSEPGFLGSIPGDIRLCTEEEIYNPVYQHQPGAKLDSEKPMLDLVLGDFAKALKEVGKVGTMGAKKYSEHGWLTVDRAETRYLSAGLRHYFEHKEGNILDDESGLLHLAHAAWNALAVLELELRK
jgi:hypothetical protein